ncbi:10508_t:CDS:2 [Entrophospora sp. SA101]|nr:2175_t:CDS:2 [Entrophospora sp. SA101]CAJ0753199.1 10508_t:CDS:2 [Entrophospora sp. SA101]CAJ0901894.1 7765_t:CDS:2 [Entrophospora sp. SA101]
MHCDLCWDNVLKSIDRDSWFIIDFDDACHAPSNIPNTQLAKESHAPEIFEFHHNENVDIWSVGPTAKDALRWLWSKYRDVLEDFLKEEEMEES